jgi:hypothetical protein
MMAPSILLSDTARYSSYEADYNPAPNKVVLQPLVDHFSEAYRPTAGNTRRLSRSQSVTALSQSPVAGGFEAVESRC